jgi:hypothetical protein
MQAFKLKAKIDQNGHLVITEPINLAPGDVEVIILQSTESPLAEATEQPKRREYKVQALKGLLENAPPTPPEFDPDRARWAALREKHNL